MLLKSRFESQEWMILRSLNTRMELSEKEKFYYLNLEKGYEGEIKFDLLAENLLEERFIINDLLLEVNNSYFQIDSLIISQGMIQLLDKKFSRRLLLKIGQTPFSYNWKRIQESSWSVKKKYYTIPPTSPKA